MSNLAATLAATLGRGTEPQKQTVGGLDFRAFAWPLAALDDGVALLAQQAGLVTRSPAAAGTPLPPASASADEQSLNRWLTLTTHQLGCDVQAVEWHYRDIALLVRRAAPAILRLPVAVTTAADTPPAPRFLLLLKGGRRRVQLLAPDFTTISVSTTNLVAFLQTQTSGDLGETVANFLLRSGIAHRRLPKAQTTLVADQMGSQRFSGCWLLSVAGHSSIWQQVRHQRLLRYLLLVAALTLLQQLVLVASWRFIGQGVFQQGFSDAGLTAWALLLITSIPLSLFANWAEINITLNLSRLARTRLLRGILNLHPPAIRHLGAGQFLERVMQTESLQALLIGGGFGVITALVQIGVALVILRLGVGGIWHSLLLAAWLLVTIGLSLWYVRRFLVWRDVYRTLTNDLVERMVAHRTRLAQEEKSTWHLAEDQQLDHYHTLTHRLDNGQRLLSSLLNRGWFLVGLTGVLYPLLQGVTNPIGLAISLAGILLAGSAFAALRSTIITLATLYATWRDVGLLFQAADEVEAVGKALYLPPVATAPMPAPAQEQKPLLMARNLQFRYHDNAPLTLSKVDLTIHPGDRLLLEGPSGGGKSTLARLLVGLQTPTSGLLLLHGLDQPTLGLTTWRQRVIAAPQFHENHVFTESFGFNLLLGRRWPATPADLQEAEALCHELGLGDLLQRMPGGLMQMVGESGWQLSHGERSRLFIARALLQQSDLIVLDESFAALDPVTLERAMTCVLKRAPTLLVIAHP
ncbi:MAG: ABC transporter ATP-binding protein [Caldilinea sp. CFX5]|nr:ABC transporter ATP-binding protein [Caldilinea sp. CFX5]